MKLFWGALYTKLAADATLVSYTGHASDNIRISYWKKDFPVNYPYIAFYDDDDAPWSAEMTTYPQQTRVIFAVFDDERETCDNILTRIQTLLQQKSASEQSQYWDISNDDICNNWTYYRRRGPIEYDDERQVFHGILIADFKWYGK